MRFMFIVDTERERAHTHTQKGAKKRYKYIIGVANKWLSHVVQKGIPSALFLSTFCIQIDLVHVFFVLQRSFFHFLCILRGVCFLTLWFRVYDTKTLNATTSNAIGWFSSFFFLFFSFFLSLVSLFAIRCRICSVHFSSFFLFFFSFFLSWSGHKTHNDYVG